MDAFHRREFLRLTAALGLSAAATLRALADAPDTPESHGVDSDAIRRFLQAVSSSKHELHSLIIKRHGATIAGGWWAPYRAGAIHSLYSLSKCLTSTAVGFAIAEGKLKLTDRVVDFFSEQRPTSVSEHLAALRVQDLLAMSVGHAVDSVGLITKEDDWVRAFLALPIERAPGSVFLYNSGASYMLSAILQKVCAMQLIEYLQPRLFDPLEIQEARWAVCPRGIDTGGWGLSMTADSVARFGQFYLQQGQWNGRQLLSRQWIEEATTFKIQQPPGTHGTPASATIAQLRQTSDWHQGYGYQFWRCRHNAFRGDGAFGQFCIVLPKQEAVIAITSLTVDSQGLLNLVWEHLLPAIHDEPLPENPAAAALLSRELSALTLPVPKGEMTSAIGMRVTEKRFAIEPNSLGANIVSMRFERSSCLFELQTEHSVHRVNCGIGAWADGVTSMPGTPPEFTEAVGRTSSPPHPIKVAAAGAWKDESTFEMRLRCYETPHYDTVTCHFDGERVRVQFMNNITVLSSGAHAEVRPVLEGRSL